MLNNIEKKENMIIDITNNMICLSDNKINDNKDDKKKNDNYFQ